MASNRFKGDTPLVVSIGFKGGTSRTLDWKLSGSLLSAFICLGGGGNIAVLKGSILAILSSVVTFSRDF